MPYKNNRTFARQTRAYIKSKERKVKPRPLKLYENWLMQVGEMFDWKDARTFTLEDLEKLETDLMKRYMESSVKMKMSVLRAMLVRTGCKAATNYEIIAMMHPARHSVYFTEEEIAKGRLAARRLSNTHELVFSWITDNGLRPRDTRLLTVENAMKLLTTGEEMIRGKGRGEGKIAKLIMSPLTHQPLITYLREREQMPGSDSTTQLMLYIDRGRTRDMEEHQVYNLYKEVMCAIGLDASPRDGRKTCGNRVYKLTRDLGMAAMILRHSSPNTTFRHYIAADSVDMAEVQNRLAGVFKSYPEGESQQS